MLDHEECRRVYGSKHLVGGDSRQCHTDQALMLTDRHAIISCRSHSQLPAKSECVFKVKGEKVIMNTVKRLQLLCPNYRYMIFVLQIPFLCMQMLAHHQFICECHHKASSTYCEEILLHENQTYEAPTLDIGEEERGSGGTKP
jgi:hypothetical protein